MGAISSAVGDVTGALGAIKDVASVATNIGSLNPFNTSSSLLAKQQQLGVQELQEKQAEEAAAADANAQIQKEELAATAQAQTDTRNRDLAASLGAEKAQFGADGIDPGDGGSAQASLLGLTSTAARSQADQDQIMALKNSAIDQSLVNLQSQNLLQQTQLAQQQKLQRIAEEY